MESSGAFDLLRGAVAVATQAGPWLHQSDIASMLNRDHSLLDRNMKESQDDLSQSLRY